MSATTHRPDLAQDVAQYVAQVRAELDDLDPDVREDLVGGLAADLADAATESQEPLDVRFGSPTEYAAELRAAAGVPPRAAVLSACGTEQRSGTPGVRSIQVPSWWAEVRSFAMAVRPAWWVLRAVIAVQLLHGLVLPGAGVGVVPLVLLLLVAVVISVELGRGRWGRRRGLAALVMAGNVLAVLAIPLLGLSGPFAAFGDDGGDGGEYLATPIGLSQGGETVRNVFPYDAQGRPLSGVQLFDQDGRPLAVSTPEDDVSTTAPDGSSAETRPVPALDAANQPVWNVFPLRQQLYRLSDDPGLAQPVGSPVAAVPRALTVPTVQVPTTPGPATAPPTAARTTPPAPAPSPSRPGS